jgi:hypothetical protein
MAYDVIAPVWSSGMMLLKNNAGDCIGANKLRRIKKAGAISTPAERVS